MAGSNEHHLARSKARATYNAASDHIDLPSNSFLHSFSHKTILKLGLNLGDKVLDLCSGTGSSAIPAAQLVGPTGQVIAVDLADQLIALAQAKAQLHHLHNIQFLTQDMLDLHFPDDHFDAIVCVFGIFFVPDMPAAVRKLWRMVKPGGKLAVTTWGHELLEPGNGIFWEVVGNVRPDLKCQFNPWERISSVGGLKEMLAEGGVETEDVTAELGVHRLERVEDWWGIAMGSGYRGTLEQMDREIVDKVHHDVVCKLEEAKIEKITTNVIYAIAQKICTD